MLCTLLPVLALILAVVAINILQTSRFENNAKETATRVGITSVPLCRDRNQVGIGCIAYRQARLWSWPTQFQTRFLESIPLPIAGLNFPTPFAR